MKNINHNYSAKTVHSAFPELIVETMSYKVNPICMKVISIVVSLLFFQTSFSQYDFSGLDSKLAEKQKLLGKDFVVLIWKKDDTLIYKKEVGDYKSKTVAPIASCSKWLTAALVMQFVDEGKLSLDDPVVKWVPEFEKYRKNYITVRHCLSHMTGIEDEGRFFKKILQRKKFSSLEEEVNAFAAREIRANAGTDFWYGNVGLNIAGRVLEVISKRKFDQLIRQKLFTPLGMRNTTFTTTDGSPPNPSGGAKSTADDYMKFLVMLMNKGTYRGKQILSEESVNEMMKTQTIPELIKYAPKVAEGFNYALGSWVMEETQPTPNEKGVATALTSPGLFGTWPMVDYCRGYAYILFVKNLLGEERAEAHLEIKKMIDEQMATACQ
jgi:CubicO group peptidase (beta-lactamase class C family)